ncbi:hypothetical protein KGP36_05940 [Patescibacteria group bacterium]|nr:hypothetical protein [Patescibacteria group bacterium]
MDLISRLVDRFTLTSKNEVVAIYPDDQSGFIDGNFDSWQIATSFSLAAATDTYTADMWVCNAGTGGAATVSQDTPALGSEPSYMTQPRIYRMSYAQTTSASTSPTIGQKLESVFQYNGQSITVSGTFAALASGTDIVGVQATQNFGTGGSPSASVVTSKTVAWALTTTEQRFSVRLDIPSIAGKTLGSNANDFLRVDFLLATGSTYTVYASQVQIDLCASTASSDTTGSGGAPQPFRWRGVGLERTRVARHILSITLPAGSGNFIGVVTSPTDAWAWFPLPSAMRATPAGSYLGGAPIFGGAVAVSGSPTVSANSNKIAALHATGSGLTAGTALYFAGGTGGTTLIWDARL